MKNTILTLLLTLIVSTAMTANGDDDKIIWTSKISQVEKLDFTPDDKYILAWTNSLSYWDVDSGQFTFEVQNVGLGDFNYNNEMIVFSQDNTPKLLNWETKEVLEGFEKEDSNFGIIETAMSKNEFMADLDDGKNTIYFWDVDTKQKIDSLNLVKTFEKGYYKWKKTIHKYGYVGVSDEAIYVVIDDVNDEIDHIEPDERRRNYYVNFYNTETKELIDSIYSFTNTNEKFGGYNKLQVANNRSKIAWNTKTEELKIYDYNQKEFVKTLELGFGGEIDEIEFSNFENKFYMSRPNNSKYLEIYDFENLSLVKQFVFLKHIIYNRIAFNSNNSLIAFSGNDSLGLGIIGLLDTQGLITNVESDTEEFTIHPNPTSSSIQIDFNFQIIQNYQLSLYDISGQYINTIDQGYSESLTYNYDINYLPSGTYFIKLLYGNQSITKQFIKE